MESQEAFPKPWSVRVCVTQPGREQGCRQLSRAALGQGLGGRDSRTAGPHRSGRNRNLVCTSAASRNHSLVKQRALTPALISQCLPPGCKLTCEGQRQLTPLLWLKAWEPESHLNLSRDAFPTCLRIFYFSCQFLSKSTLLPTERSLKCNPNEHWRFQNQKAEKRR